MATISSMIKILTILKHAEDIRKQSEECKKCKLIENGLCTGETLCLKVISQTLNNHPSNINRKIKDINKEINIFKIFYTKENKTKKKLITLKKRINDAIIESVENTWSKMFIKETQGNYKEKPFQELVWIITSTGNTHLEEKVYNFSKAEREIRRLFKIHHKKHQKLKYKMNIFNSGYQNTVPKLEKRPKKKLKCKPQP